MEGVSWASSDPSQMETLPCSLPREFSPPLQPEPPCAHEAVTLAEIDQQILELESLGPGFVGGGWQAVGVWFHHCLNAMGLLLCQ